MSEQLDRIEALLKKLVDGASKSTMTEAEKNQRRSHLEGAVQPASLRAEYQQIQADLALTAALLSTNRKKPMIDPLLHDICRISAVAAQTICTNLDEDGLRATPEETAKKVAQAYLSTLELLISGVAAIEAKQSAS